MKKQDKAKAKQLVDVLSSFKVTGEIVAVSTGPVVTLFEFEPDPGVRTSRVIGLTDDIARAMSAVSCRASVIPGKSTIGIELPNAKRDVVPFDEIVNTDGFKNGPALAFAMGKAIDGSPVVSDIARMPHLLMAGTTGSGKSVAMNTLIYSILCRMTPDQCKFVMIDPKQLELSVYEGIPHLLMPVVTDPLEAVEALRWTVREMEDRYRKMSDAGVRNITGYNAAKDAKLPYIVVVIDEVADLMMVAGKDIEALVQRLAQMARAAGIHVIMATQRPSVDVITGTIKANFPTRIAFKVTSKFDSQTILGEKGAEQLLGMGDMLFMSGSAPIKRVHGAFVTDDTIQAYVAKLKASGAPQYVSLNPEAEAEYQEQPDLYTQACRFVMTWPAITTTEVQRAFQLPYLNAFDLVQRMEADGLVGPVEGGERRVILPE